MYQTSQWKTTCLHIFVLKFLLFAWEFQVVGPVVDPPVTAGKLSIMDQKMDGLMKALVEIKVSTSATWNSNMSGTLGDIQTFIMQHVHVFMIDVHN